MKLGPGLSFSWKRALGVTKAKRRVSKKTGIPMSRGGRRKFDPALVRAAAGWSSGAVLAGNTRALSGELSVEQFQKSWS